MQEIYYMTTTMKYTPEYVESIIPMERNLYISYYLEDIRKQNQKEKGQYDVLSDNIPDGITMQGDM